MNVAIIPARGGSKRIPRKNIRNFHGEPLISYSIQSAIKSKLFDKIIISTDDEEIANISREYGAEVPFMRPEDLATDTAGMHEVILHALNWLTVNNFYPNNICCISATAPFLVIEDLIRSFDAFVESEKSYIFSSTEFNFPVQRSFVIKNDDGVELLFPEHYHTRSQDLEPVYHDAGQFYWGTVDAWKNEKDIYTNDTNAYLLPSWRVQDIDTLDDLKRAEVMFDIIKKMEDSNVV